MNVVLNSDMSNPNQDQMYGDPIYLLGLDSPGSITISLVFN